MLYLRTWSDKAVRLRTIIPAIAVLTCSSVSTFAADPEVVNIRLEAGVFVLDPADKEIEEGQSIKWVPVDLPDVTHNLVADDPINAFEETDNFNGKNPPTRSFDKPGTIRYHCTKHEKTMIGTITVK